MLAGAVGGVINGSQQPDHPLVTPLCSGESKPECTGMLFRGPVKTKESIPGPQNVSILTGTVVLGPQ